MLAYIWSVLKNLNPDSFSCFSPVHNLSKPGTFRTLPGNARKHGVFGLLASSRSLVLILVWVFYTVIIFILGAEFTQFYAREKGHGIQPAEHAVWVHMQEAETE